MPTELLPTRKADGTEKLGRGFAWALGVHAIAIGALFVGAYVSHRSNIHWGDKDPLAGAMQVSSVSSLPLPPRQKYKADEVLASEKPSVAPAPPAPAPVAPKPKATPAPAKAEPKPEPKAIPIVKAPAKPAPRAAERPQPAPTRPAPAPKPEPVTPAPAQARPAPPTPKATSGETAGIQIPQSVVQAKNGTSAISIEERSFGDRFAYYVKQINQAIQRSKQQEPDGPETRGKRTVIRFTIDRDGAPSEVEVTTRSGSSALDQSTQRAIQRIDSFGPLPSGYSHVTVNVGYLSQ